MLVATLICLAFMFAEVGGGIWANSLALLSDAAHMLTDVAAFGVTLWAAWLAGRKGGVGHTFGLHR